MSSKPVEEQQQFAQALISFSANLSHSIKEADRLKQQLIDLQEVTEHYIKYLSEL